MENIKKLTILHSNDLYGDFLAERIDDLGRVVIPKEIRRAMRIREGEPSHNTLMLFDKFCVAIHSLAQRITAQ